MLAGGTFSRALLGLLDAPKVPAASPALSLSHGPRGQRLGMTKLFFPREGCAFFKGWGFNYNVSALSRT